MYKRQNVDSPRYNYSDGIWENGKMNGQGTTGYCYYENVPQGEYAWAVKTGVFADDQMEGDVYKRQDQAGIIDDSGGALDLAY